VLLAQAFFHIDGGLVVGGLLGGFLVGLTGMGGGALLTPMLVLIFHVSPLAAISSDLVVSLAIKPVGAAVHAKKRTVRRDIVKWLALGSVPTAFAGAVLLDVIGAKRTHRPLEIALGITLVTAAIAMSVRMWMAYRRRHGIVSTTPTVVRPWPTLAIGLAGGLIVGLTSVGSGSLMLVLMMWVYPRLTTAELVGTDLAQAIPLVASAALGHVLFGEVQVAVVGALLLGAFPGVWIGSHVSSRAPDHVVRPALATVLVATGLKLLRFV
jgi:uncharacterized protein